MNGKYRIFWIVVPVLIVFYLELFAWLLIIPLIFTLRISFRNFILLILGILIGCFAVLRTEKDAFWTGLPVEEITRVCGVVQEDSRTLDSGSELVLFQLIEVENSKGYKTNAGGTVSLFIDKRLLLFQGSTICLNADICLQKERGIYLTGEVESVELLGIKPLFAFRSGLHNKINALFSLSESSSLLQALFLGIRDNLDQNLEELFRKAGVSHILALSGMHIGLLAGFLSLAFKWIRISFIKILLIALILGSYVFLTGSRPSLVRALFLFLMIQSCRFLHFSITPISSLGVVFLLMTVWNPSNLYSLSFQLSFLALGGILFVSGIISPPSKPLSLALNGLLISMGAQMATFPLVLFQFGSFYPVGIITGLVLTPFISIYYLGGLFLHLAGILPECPPPGWILLPLYRCIERILVFFSHFPGISEGKMATLYFMGLIPAFAVLYKACNGNKTAADVKL